MECTTTVPHRPQYRDRAALDDGDAAGAARFTGRAPQNMIRAGIK